MQRARNHLPNRHAASALATPFASHTPTRHSEPIAADRILRISYPIGPGFLSLSNVHRQSTALEKAATDAGIHVLQSLDEVGTATTTIFTDL